MLHQHVMRAISISFALSCSAFTLLSIIQYERILKRRIKILIPPINIFIFNPQEMHFSILHILYKVHFQSLESFSFPQRTILIFTLPLFLRRVFSFQLYTKLLYIIKYVTVTSRTFILYLFLILSVLPLMMQQFSFFRVKNFCSRLAFRACLYSFTA